MVMELYYVVCFNCGHIIYTDLTEDDLLKINLRKITCEGCNLREAVAILKAFCEEE